MKIIEFMQCGDPAITTAYELGYDSLGVRDGVVLNGVQYNKDERRWYGNLTIDAAAAGLDLAPSVPQSVADAARRIAEDPAHRPVVIRGGIRLEYDSETETVRTDDRVLGTDGALLTKLSYAPGTDRWIGTWENHRQHIDISEEVPDSVKAAAERYLAGGAELVCWPEPGDGSIPDISIKDGRLCRGDDPVCHAGFAFTKILASDAFRALAVSEKGNPVFCDVNGEWRPYIGYKPDKKDYEHLGAPIFTTHYSTAGAPQPGWPVVFPIEDGSDRCWVFTGEGYGEVLPLPGPVLRAIHVDAWQTDENTVTLVGKDYVAEFSPMDYSLYRDADKLFEEYGEKVGGSFLHLYVGDASALLDAPESLVGYRITADKNVPAEHSKVPGTIEGYSINASRIETEALKAIAVKVSQNAPVLCSSSKSENAADRGDDIGL